MRIRIHSQRGQALIESVLALPLFLTTILLFLIFLYESLWTQTIEYIVNEGIICDSTAGEDDCLAKANQKANESQIWGRVKILRTDRQEWIVHFYLIRNYRWKTLLVKPL